MQMVEMLTSNKLHRLYVTDDDNMPCAVITLTDVLRTVCEVSVFCEDNPQPPKTLVLLLWLMCRAS